MAQSKAKKARKELCENRLTASSQSFQQLRIRRLTTSAIVREWSRGWQVNSLALDAGITVQCKATP